MDEGEKAESETYKDYRLRRTPHGWVVLRPTTGEIVCWGGQCFFPSRHVARQVVNADLKG